MHLTLTPWQYTGIGRAELREFPNLQSGCDPQNIFHLQQKYSGKLSAQYWQYGVREKIFLHKVILRNCAGCSSNESIQWDNDHLLWCGQTGVVDSQWFAACRTQVFISVIQYDTIHITTKDYFITKGNSPKCIVYLYHLNAINCKISFPTL